MALLAPPRAVYVSVGVKLYTPNERRHAANHLVVRWPVRRTIVNRLTIPFMSRFAGAAVVAAPVLFSKHDRACLRWGRNVYAQGGKTISPACPSVRPTASAAISARSRRL